jgi:DNA topoisomerase-1
VAKKENTGKKKTKAKATGGRSKFKKKYLVIVESPAKAKTIEKFLGKDYGVLASMGHVRDLPKSRLAVDVDHGFEPQYIVIKGKTKLIKQLKEAAQKSEMVYLAPDPDREGEAIAWHLAQVLGVTADHMKRIEFNEITKSAVQAALQAPRDIDMHRVNAQQTRRILDRLVGYKISPLLWKNVLRGLSAGRVQSVAMRIICDREAEIESFRPEEYWSITAQLLTGRQEAVTAQLFSRVGEQKKIEIKNSAEAEMIVGQVRDKEFLVSEVRKKERAKNPTAPFTTSTLQQEASRKLGFGAYKTMMVAQQLYEGVDIDGETVGLITYMRTDSVRIAAEALHSVRELITQKFGGKAVPEAPRFYKTKKSAQDAHEAIRPTDVTKEPNNIRNFLTPEQFKLYGIIWKRFVASQMNSAVLDVTSVDITAGEHLFRATGSVVKVPGFMAVYLEGHDEEPAAQQPAGTEEENGIPVAKNGRPEEVLLPELVQGEKLKLQELSPEQHFTQPLPRYTEASLVKILEEKGIGRPSTYAPILSTIQFRGYVLKQGKALVPTELGRKVNGQLVKHFPEIVDIGFTATLEDELDRIIEGDVEWPRVLKDFYQPFALTVEKAEKNMENIKEPDQITEEKCEKCGKPMAIKTGRFGKFLACTGFPDCKNTKSLKKIIAGVKCPLCGADIIEKMTSRKKVFYGCGNYPKCNFGSWDKPLPDEKCPTCGAFMVERKKGDEMVKLCIMCDIKNKETKKTEEGSKKTEVSGKK